MKEVGFAVVGIRNFAATYIKNIIKLEKEGAVRLTGLVVKDQIKNAIQIREARRQGIRIFDSYEQLLREGKEYVDVIALPTSIHSHAEMTMQGMKHGYNILLEKPPAPTIEQIDDMIRTERETGKFCAVGFQFIYARSIRKLKKCIIDGQLGVVEELACKACWPRDKSYYNRNPWAGKSIWNGMIVLDGPMHNAFAHFLNNMLLLASQKLDETAELKTVRAELYRAHSYIVADDTSCLQAETKSGSKIYFFVTHASKEVSDPYIEIRGTKGRAFWHFDGKTIIQLNNGEVFRFDNENADPWLEVIRVTAKVSAGILDKPYCTLENSRNFVVAINGAYDSAKRVQPIPKEYVKEFLTEENGFKTEVEDIDSIIDLAFDKRKLFSDLGLVWSHKTEIVNVENYKHFNPFK